MATEKQYLFFKSVYDEETARQASLQDRAKYYLSIITFYSAFILFVAEKLKPTNITLKVVFVAAVGSMLVAFLYSLWSIKISNYEAPSDPNEIIDGFQTAPPTDEDFFDDRIIDYAVAYERNSAVNDSKANQLSVAGYWMLVGLTAHALYFTVRLVLLP